MNAAHLNEHDANQGAQSSGEFLGMTGNSGWYLLGSGGMTVLMVILLWGTFGVSLLLCLFVGLVLCLLSLAYVFALKNNKPEHYDTDFFESSLVEAGVMELRFGPQKTRLVNPFASVVSPVAEAPAKPLARQSFKAEAHGKSRLAERAAPTAAAVSEDSAAPAKKEPVVAREAYEDLQERLRTTEEQLEDALVERGED